MTRIAAVLIVVLGILTACTSSTRSGAASTPSSGSSDVSFVVDGTTTYGTLEIPDQPGDGRLAAALLLPGSGPTDRNGNQAGGASPNTLKVVADVLAQHGIMSLRFDKYGTGRTGAGRYAADPGSFPVDADLGQADAAYAFLARQPRVDTAKLLVVGHSYGGLLALHVATAESPKPAGVALLEPQDLRALDLIRIQTDEQIDGLLARGTLTADQARTNASVVAQAIDEFRSGQPVSTDGMAAPIAQLITPTLVNNPQETFLRGWDAIMPVALAADVQRGTRVLITAGTRDGKVPTGTIAPLARALESAGGTGPGLQTIQGTDHDMHLSSQPDDQAVLAPAVVSAIGQWAQPY